MASRRLLRIVPRWSTPLGGRSRGARLSLGALTALALPAAALAATLNVNSSADELIAGNGQCTLREAIINANGDSDWTGGDCPAGSGADLINVPSGTYTLTIPGVSENAGATGDLDITDDLTLRGTGAATTALVQTAFDAVVDVRSGNVVIERLRVTGQNHGLWNQGNLIVSDATISELGTNGSFNGLGIFNSGDLLLRRSAVIDIFGTGLLTTSSDYSVHARVEGSTISGNTSDHYSPAIASMELCDPFFNCTGPIIQPVEVSNSTIAGNFSLFTPAGAAVYWAETSSIKGTLLDNPDSFNCVRPSGSLGHNLDSDGSCGLTDPTDLSNVDPLLGPLQNNGGPTPTHALQLGSPVIDAIPSAACTYDHDGEPGTPEVALTKDQRGGMRPREGDGSAPSGCDIGAYEVAPCADGLDNDGDGLVDFDGGATAGLTPLASPDPTCTSALGAAEAPPPPSSGCGIGPELLLLGPLLAAARRRPLVGPRPRRAGPLQGSSPCIVKSALVYHDVS